MSYNKETGLYEGFIYCLTNKVNNKKYIGQTTSTIEHRMTQHFSKGKKRNYAINLAISKYGKDNFTVEEIEKICNQNKEKLIEILNEKEIYYIDKFHSHVNEYGYNISKGGNQHDCNGRNVDVYDLDGNYLNSFNSMSEASQYYHVSIHIVNDMCCGYTNRSRKCDYIFRFKNESFDKYDTNYIIGGAKEVYQFTLDGEFVASYKSISDAELCVNPNHNCSSGCSISRAIFNNKTAYGFVWSYDKKFKFNPSNYRNWVAVDKYSMDGELLGKYDSIRAAAESVGKAVTDGGNISSVCKGKTFNAFGYVWRYKGDPFDKYPTKYVYKNNRPINQYTKDNIFVKHFNSAKEAGISLGVSGYGNITNCCKYKIPSFKGYKWFYADDINQPDQTRITA